ncbi:MAG: hypothetical protein IT459_17615 [Planctomycetes bacterium]|nr:hypothetical protein [Planctomycetota bacterium]
MAAAPNDTEWVKYEPGGTLVYETDADGARIPDFSRCGYKQGSPVPIVDVGDLPSARIKLVTPTGSPSVDRANIQAALDDLASKVPLIVLNGDVKLRGIVILDDPNTSTGEVVFRIDQTLRIRASGIILRGMGTAVESKRTVLRGEGESCNPLILVQDGIYDGSAPPYLNVESRREAGTTRNVAPVVYPIGTTEIDVRNADGIFAYGDEVLVHRIAHDGTYPGTTDPLPSNWIQALDNSLHNALSPTWSASKATGWTLEGGPPDDTLGSYDHYWTRTVLDVVSSPNGHRLVLDAPIFAPLDPNFGRANVSRFIADDIVNTVGIEDLVLESRKANGSIPTGADENHPANGVSFGAARNCWMRGVHGLFFVYTFVTTQRDTQWITILGCRAEEPVSQVAGGRRYAFNILGQDHLVYRCFAKDAALSFVSQGNKSDKKDGPSTGIAFVECVARRMYSEIGPHSYGTAGNLWDNVLMKNPRMDELADQRALVLGFNGWDDHGWAALSSITWNCRCLDVNEQRVGRFVVEYPTGFAGPTPLRGWRSWAVGCDAQHKTGNASFDFWNQTYVLTNPVDLTSFESLYRAQLHERIGFVWLPDLYLNDFD